ncbi:MAG: pentapeptide repeat-containing protein [Frankiales bacterium]|nr:pentapeptide repeat-containing protein [Frankiales bacterium]
MQVTFGGEDWRTTPELAAPMFAVLPVMRQLHELLWYLVEAAALTDGPLRDDVVRLQAATEQLTRADPGELAAVDVGGHSKHVGAVLDRVSSHVRGQVRDRPADRRRADLIGSRLTDADLQGASLRGALLIGADLQGADLRRADLLGADLRGADLRRADLTGALFVTQPQLISARGDAATRIPSSLRRPGHWGE